MAEDKKGFLLYADYLSLVEELSDAEAGKLFKHILEYVNDKNPVLPDEREVRIALSPIKHQLKRDLKKYEDKKGTKSENGAIGNLKRWHPEVYEKLRLKQITIEEALEITKKSPPVAGNRVATNPIANIAVNDSVNDNVSGSDIKAIPPGIEPVKFVIDVETELINSHQWIELAAKNYKTSVKFVNELLLEFIAEMKLKDRLCEGINEMKDYFINRLKLEVQRKQREEILNPQTNRPPVFRA